MKRILTVGCSFTYGTELPDVADSCSLTDLANQSQLSWPWILARHYSAQVTNLAISGGSNGRTFRVAMSQSARSKYDLVVCQWTGIERPDWQFEGSDMPTNPGKYNCELYPGLGYYYKQHSNKNHSFQTWISQVVALQDHFKLIGQPYIFLSVTGRDTYTDTQVENDYVDLINMIDQQHFVGWHNNTGIVDWTHSCPKGPYGHPLELGHETIAAILQQHIVSKDLL